MHPARAMHLGRLAHPHQLIAILALRPPARLSGPRRALATASAAEPWYTPAAPASPDAETALTFSCTQCGACCTGESGLVLFSREEGRRMAARLDMTPAQFYRRYAHRVSTRGVIDADRAWALREVQSKQGLDCALLGASRECTVYADRPLQCSAYPLWTENVASRESWEQVKAECPGVARADGSRFSAENVASTLRDLETYWVVVETEAQDEAWRPE
jgi:Fe-S-cluster containining protein